MTVHQLEHSMTYEELVNWSVYLSEESPDPQELQMSVLLSMISSYMGGKSKREDFLIRKEANTQTKKKPISNESILAMFQTLSAK